MDIGNSKNYLGINIGLQFTETLDYKSSHVSMNTDYVQLKILHAMKIDGELS